MVIRFIAPDMRWYPEPEVTCVIETHTGGQFPMPPTTITDLLEQLSTSKAKENFRHVRRIIINFPVAPNEEMPLEKR